MRRSAQSKPHAPAGLLDGTRECAIVDQFAGYSRDAADRFQSGAADQDAPAGCARGAAMGIADPRRRVKLEEEKMEGLAENNLVKKVIDRCGETKIDIETLGLIIEVLKQENEE